MNERYLNFKQKHFTAGDEEQFEHRRNRAILSPDIPIPCRSFEIELANQIRWEHYRNLKPSDIRKTFDYIFHKFKKGIFIQIHQNRLSVMLPFSKHAFVNEWSERIEFDPMRYNSWNELFQTATEQAGYKFKESSVHQHREKWYANNGLIRYEFPIQEGETGVDTINDMFTALCNERDVPDIEIFVNRRDFPILTKDGTEAYDAIFGENTKLLSHAYERYAPILSMCSANRFADIPIPSTDDWIQANEAVDYPKDWLAKRNVAVFRGSSTGLGTTLEDNIRLKVAKMSEEDSTGILDVGITKWNLRVRKNRSCKYFDIPQRDGLRIVEPMSALEQARCRYIIHIPGHVCAFRLSRELSYGSVILLVQSEYFTWYQHLLKPFVHYIPVDADASNLMERLEWCQSHTLECKQIAQNAYEFWKLHLSREAILDYLQTILVRIKTRVGTYRYLLPSPIETIRTFEQQQIEKIYRQFEEIPVTNTNVFQFDYVHEYGFLRAFQWLFCRNPSIVAAYRKNPIHNGNRHREMYSIQMDTLHLLCKTDCSMHEFFMGFCAINSLIRYVPNFSYTFGRIDNVVYTEFFKDSITLFEYIQSERFDFDVYLKILQQVAFALHEAQTRIGFVHWDLAVWNIVIRKRKKPIDIQYLYLPHEFARIQVDYDVIIVDYENAHCVYDGIHCGKIHPFTIDTIHDILALLFTSLHAILRYQTLSKRDLSRVFILTTFFSPSTYTNHQTFRTIRDLRIFLNRAKKFSELLSRPKDELARYTPLDFVRFLQEHLEVKFELDKSRVREFKPPFEHYAEITKTQPSNPLLDIPIEYITPEKALVLYNRLPNYGQLESRIRDYKECVVRIPETIIFTMDDLEDGIGEILEHIDENLRGWITEQLELFEFSTSSRNRSYWIQKWMSNFLKCTPQTHQRIGDAFTRRLIAKQLK